MSSGERHASLKRADADARLMSVLRSSRKPRAVWFVACALVAACGGNDVRQPIDEVDELWPIASAELRDGMTQERKAEVLARWVAANGTNEHTDRSREPVPFFGLCDKRARVFRRLATRAGLPARVVAFERFGDSGHMCAEVHYDGSWHFFDVTYAGMFSVEGRVLSRQEIEADPERAIDHMVVFAPTHDGWTDGRPVDNHERMKANYTAEHVRGWKLVAGPRRSGTAVGRRVGHGG